MRKHVLAFVAAISLTIIVFPGLMTAQQTLVHFELKTGDQYDTIVDSVFWWGMKFQDTRAVMFKQIKTLETISQPLVHKITDLQPEVTQEKSGDLFVLDFSHVTEFRKPKPEGKFFQRYYILANALSEKGEFAELQLYSVPEGIPYLVVMMAASGGFVHTPASSYSQSTELPSRKRLRHIVFGYTFGFGYRHTFGDADFSIIPAFSKKVDTITQKSYVVDEISDVAFFVDLKYRYGFRNNLVAAFGTRLYFHTIPVQRSLSDIQLNVGLGWMFGE